MHGGGGGGGGEESSRICLACGGTCVYVDTLVAGLWKVRGQSIAQQSFTITEHRHSNN